MAKEKATKIRRQPAKKAVKEKKVALKKPEKNPLLSIIIVSFNTKETIKQTIDSIFALDQKIASEIIVVDNNSNDGSIEMLEKYRKEGKLQLICNQRNLGFGNANDRGARLARGKYLLFLNPDTIVPADALVKTVHFLDHHPEIGVVGPRVVLNDEKQALQKSSFGRFTTPLRILTRLTRIDPKLDKNKNYTYVDWVTGAALFIRGELFLNLKGFDENIFMYFEDEDLCKRAKELDYDVAVFHEAEIIHLGGKSSNSKTKKLFYDQSQNYFIAKHFGLFWLSIINIFRAPYRLMQK